MKNVIQKPWGHETILHENDMYVVKGIYVKAGHRLSLQYHEKKTETIFMIYGGYIDTNDIQERIDYIEEVDGREIFMERRKLSKQEPVFIRPGVIHRIGAGKSDAMFVEVSTCQLKDVVRLKDDYGR